MSTAAHNIFEKTRKISKILAFLVESDNFCQIKKKKKKYAVIQLYSKY